MKYFFDISRSKTYLLLLCLLSTNNLEIHSRDQRRWVQSRAHSHGYRACRIIIMSYIATTHRFLNKHLRPAKYSYNNLFARGDLHAYVVHITTVDATLPVSVYRLGRSLKVHCRWQVCDLNRIATCINDSDFPRVNIPPDLTSSHLVNN